LPDCNECSFCAVFTIGIENDKIPEIDEPILVELTNPEGGSAIGQFDHVKVIVKANDHVAGLISFSKTSYLVKEGRPWNGKQ